MSTENISKNPNSLNEHWMPFTSNREFKQNPRLITDAKGVYLKDHLGRTQIDASSGLFCNPLGHGRKEIIEAITKQLEKLDYCQPFNQGFGGSFELATRISKHTPEDLNKIFYTICGSTAVETALKIAIAYHKAKGHGHKYRFVGREKGYHGMNLGGMSVGGMINNVKTFASVLMPGVLHMRHTMLPEHKFVKGQPDTGAELADDLERFCANFGGENIAACIVEPISGGKRRLGGKERCGWSATCRRVSGGCAGGGAACRGYARGEVRLQWAVGDGGAAGGGRAAPSWGATGAGRVHYG